MQRFAVRTCLMSRWGHTGNQEVNNNPTALRDQRLRLCTGGIFGYGPGFDVEHEIVTYGRAKSPQDWKDGGICQATGYRAPASLMVEVDGMRFIREFAPDRVNK